MMMMMMVIKLDDKKIFTGTTALPPAIMMVVQSWSLQYIETIHKHGQCRQRFKKAETARKWLWAVRRTLIIR